MDTLSIRFNWNGNLLKVDIPKDSGGSLVKIQSGKVFTNDHGNEYHIEYDQDGRVTFLGWIKPSSGERLPDPAFAKADLEGDENEKWIVNPYQVWAKVDKLAEGFHEKSFIPQEWNRGDQNDMLAGPVRIFLDKFQELKNKHGEGKFIVVQPTGEYDAYDTFDEAKKDCTRDAFIAKITSRKPNFNGRKLISSFGCVSPGSSSDMRPFLFYCSLAHPENPENSTPLVGPALLDSGNGYLNDVDLLLCEEDSEKINNPVFRFPGNKIVHEAILHYGLPGYPKSSDIIWIISMTDFDIDDHQNGYSIFSITFLVRNGFIIGDENPKFRFPTMDLS